MYCKNCGSQNVNGEKFCKNCGTLLETSQPQQVNNNINSQAQQPLNQGMIGTGTTNQYYANNQQQQMYNQQPINNGMNGQSVNQPSMNQIPNQQYQNNNGNLDSNYINQAVNPNMKKWAVLSVVIPIVAIVWYFFIGLSFYIAVAIAGAGFSFAEKGKMSAPKLAKIGKILNIILMVMAFAMLIMNLILAFAS